MINFFRDSIWQFAGFIVSIIAIVVTVIIYFRQKNFKEISYEIISESSLLSISKEVESKLQILFDGKPVKGVHLILLRIANTGNLPIIPSDYIRNLSILFSGNVNILSAEITNRSPNDIDTTIVINDGNITFSPSLLNSEDSIILKALVSQFDGTIDVRGRITGVKNIRCLRSSVNTSSKLYLSASLASPIVIFLLNPLTKMEFGFSLFLSVLLSYILIIIPVADDAKYRKIISGILKSFGVPKFLYIFIYTIIFAAIVFAGIATVPEIKCSFANASDTVCFAQVELIIQDEIGHPLPGTIVDVIGEGNQDRQYTDLNGYTKILIRRKGYARLTIHKEGYPVQGFNVNLANDSSQVRIIRMSK
jgi:hypothetical protein